MSLLDEECWEVFKFQVQGSPDPCSLDDADCQRPTVVVVAAVAAAAAAAAAAAVAVLLLLLLTFPEAFS